MPARRIPTPRDESVPRRPPATTPDGRENQLIAMAYDLAERQLLDGTASAQVITQFLKAGSARDRLERTKIQGDIELTKAKIQQIANVEKITELYTQAISSMRNYAGDFSQENTDDYPPDFEDFAERY
jgi:predicted lipid-binding transport protein (Tim44 family)